jgi:hypothetical protein
VYAAPWAELMHCGSYNFSGYLGRQSWQLGQQKTERQ